MSVMLAMLLPLAQVNCVLMPLRPTLPVHHPDDRKAESGRVHDSALY